MINNYMDDSIESDVSSLVDQLKENTAVVKKVSKSNDLDLNKDNLEQFIMDSSGKLISDSLSIIDEMRDFVEVAPDSDTISSLADLLKASTGAIDTLNKLLVQNKRSDTQKEVKQMDIDSRKDIADADNKTRILLTRDEVFQKLMKQAEVVEDVPGSLPESDITES